MAKITISDVNVVFDTATGKAVAVTPQAGIPDLTYLATLSNAQQTNPNIVGAAGVGTDGTWTTKYTVTDASYTAGGVHINIRSSGVPEDLYIDQIVFS